MARGRTVDWINCPAMDSFTQSPMVCDAYVARQTVLITSRGKRYLVERSTDKNWYDMTLCGGLSFGDWFESLSGTRTPWRRSARRRLLPSGWAACARDHGIHPRAVVRVCIESVAWEPETYPRCQLPECVE